MLADDQGLVGGTAGIDAELVVDILGTVLLGPQTEFAVVDSAIDGKGQFETEGAVRLDV